MWCQQECVWSFELSWMSARSKEALRKQLTIIAISKHSHSAVVF